MNYLLKKYEEARQQLYDHVGFVEDWVVCPIELMGGYHWKLKESKVVYHDDPELVRSENGDHYEDDIYTQRFYSKWVYRGEDLTLIFCDPHVDGVQWFRVFENNLEIK